MSGDDARDKPSWTQRDKLSFSELDRRRRERRSSGDAPAKGPGAQAREGAATQQYLKHLDGMFSKSGGAEAERLANAMHDAHGTPGLADACRAYRDELGVPDDPSLLSLFLDSGDRELVLVGLEALGSAHAAGALRAKRGLKTQLELLAQGSDDAVAEAAEDLLDAF